MYGHVSTCLRFHLWGLPGVILQYSDVGARVGFARVLTLASFKSDTQITNGILAAVTFSKLVGNISAQLQANISSVVPSAHRSSRRPFPCCSRKRRISSRPWRQAQCNGPRPSRRQSWEPSWRPTGFKVENLGLCNSWPFAEQHNKAQKIQYWFVF